jgi:hypothetical protein
MRIQEMRSGLEHLRKRAESETKDNFFDFRLSLEPDLSWPDPVIESTSELDEARWSVVSFDQIEAGGLTYRQAAELMSLLDGHGISGLCVITDEAAARMSL